jgi:tRNAThr (cytosine32-N3)-methyltransferase
LIERFNGDPAKWWNLFYKNNTANFFKDRKWLQQEFPVLDTVTSEGAGPVTLLEIGAGAGNTAFPILASNRNPELKIHACDFSKKAVEVMRSHEAYGSPQIQADVWDVAGDELPPDLGEGSVDVALMVFIFSALSPRQWKKAVDNVYRVLKPGGEVCFRDYGRGDLAQVRFKKGRYLEENFYIRGDGTRVYFFEIDELASIWKGELAAEDDGQETKDEATPAFVVEALDADRRMLVNRAKKLKMYRCWLQGRFRKPKE